MMLVSWTKFKNLIDVRGINFIKFNYGDYYTLKGYDGPLEIRTDIIPGSSEDTEYISVYADKEQMPSAPKTIVSGIPKVAIYRPEGRFENIISHNFCDPTTWYQESTEVLSESLSAGAGTTYNFVNTNVIDVENGKVSGENNYSYDFEAQANTQTLRDKYKTKIYIDGVLQTTGYAMNYAAGTVTFDSTPNGPVTADYHYESGSRFTVAPLTITDTIHVEHVELQFTTDIGITNPLIKEIRITDPDSPPSKLVVEYVEHQNEYDIINVASGGQASIPQHGSLASDVLVFPCQYGRTIDLKGSNGSDISVRLDNNTSLTGTFATITFYTSSEE